ncbi:hypothetical protein [Cupriavidus sp. WS]|uniref:hypothetical protein n=1 Tax=Cupriavidus sp. WS TaxID=1312922 RepID=UPI0005B95670|nr:hypothetical protein [Cupriavidus sp. WS]
MTSAVMGKIMGTVHLPEHVAANAKQLARKFFATAEANEFCGDAVETYVVPFWATRLGTDWLPDISQLGYRRAGRPSELVATAGVDSHTDDIGLVLMVVLHNDGLAFRQGRVIQKAKAGDWFIFDDRRPHEVREADGNASFLGWHIPLIGV